MNNSSSAIAGSNFVCVRFVVGSANSVSLTMPPPELPDWWMKGRTDTLSPWSQAQVWASVKVSAKRRLNLSDQPIADEVQTFSGGGPASNTIRICREKFEADPHWYPGKQTGDADSLVGRKLLPGSRRPA